MLCRSNYGDYFGITVAGYPEAHPEVISDDPNAMEKAYQSDLQYLKKKVGWSCRHMVLCVLSVANAIFVANAVP